jgi:hypothetical protein
MRKFLIVISEKTKKGETKKVYSVDLKDRDTKKEVLPNCDNLDDVFMFCAGLNAELKKNLGEMPVVFDAKDPKGYHFKLGKEVARNFKNS